MEMNEEEIALKIRDVQELNDGEALNSLINDYNWLFEIYTHLIYTDIVAFNFNNKFHREFISMFIFIPHEALGVRCGNVKYKNIAFNKYKYLKLLMLNSIKEKELYNECICAFIYMVRTCRDPLRFKYYILTTYHKRLADCIKYNVDTLSHQMSSLQLKLIDEINELNCDNANNMKINYNEPAEEDEYENINETGALIMDAEYDDLGSNWIRGITCDEKFKNLTCFERLELKHIFEQTDRNVMTQIFGKHKVKFSNSIKTLSDKVINEVPCKPKVCDCGNKIFQIYKRPTAYMCKECSEAIVRSNKELKLAIKMNIQATLFLSAGYKMPHLYDPKAFEYNITKMVKIKRDP